MKKIMIKLLPVMTLILVLALSRVNVFAGSVLTVSATQEDGAITVSGTTEAGMQAVAIMVYDKAGTTLITMETAAVSDSNAYSHAIAIEEGDYVIKVADYDGGATVETTVTAAVKITAINVTLTAPTVGDKVTTTEVGDAGIGEMKQDNPPKVAAETGANYTIEDTMWITGTYPEIGDDFENPFSGTFVSDTYYYAEIFVSAKDGYAISDDVTIKVNGEAPAEVFPVYGGKNTFFIAKIKSTAATTAASTSDAATTTAAANDDSGKKSPSTGDTAPIAAVMVFALLGAAGIIVVGSKKRMMK